MDYKQRARELEPELIENRRTIHGYAELGFDLPKTVAFVESKLRSYGIEPIRVGKAGVSALIGNPGGKTILLRADMDALPMEEETGYSFAAANGHCHSCGHDTHTTMLLGAAKLLKENEANLKGYVKLMFQPAEELLAGAADMIAGGILDNPKVDRAFGMHILPGDPKFSKPGAVLLRSGYSTYSGDCIRISVKGKQAHGASTELGVDAISIAAHIVLALQELPAREVSMDSKSVVLVGMINGGSSCNTMSGECVMEASVRADSEELRAFLKQRVKEVAEATAKAYRGEAIVEYVYGMPALRNDENITELVREACTELLGEENVNITNDMSGSEDFTAIANVVPSTFIHIGAGLPLDGYECGLHHPSMKLDEGMLKTGAAVYAQCAEKLLEE